MTARDARSREKVSLAPHPQGTDGYARLYQPLLRGHASRGLMLAGAELPARRLSSIVAARALVCRSRNSLYLGAGRRTNFGFESTLATRSNLVWFGFEVPKRGCHRNDGNFKSTTLASQSALPARRCRPTAQRGRVAQRM